MRVRMFAALAVALVAGVAASSSLAVPAPGDVKVTPVGNLDFGYVPVGQTVVKFITIHNRTGQALTYASAVWPGQSYMAPQGIWGSDRLGEPSPMSEACYYLDPGESCHEYFEFTPYFAGLFTAVGAGGTPIEFSITYKDGDGHLYPSNAVPMFGVGY